jgi:hypothetical protein
MVGSWCPPNSEVHGLVLHGQAVRSMIQFTVVSEQFSVKNSPESLAANTAVRIAILH